MWSLLQIFVLFRIAAARHVFSCARGQFVAPAGTCRDCPPGKFSFDQVVCLPCPRGQYASGSGALACNKCAVNAFQSLAGAASCRACPLGKLQRTRGSVSCEMSRSAKAAMRCAVGHFLLVLTRPPELRHRPAANPDAPPLAAPHCVPCPGGKYQPSATATRPVCHACAAGHASVPPPRSHCVVSCPAGSYAKRVVLGSAAMRRNAAACVACPAGTFALRSQYRTQFTAAGVRVRLPVAGTGMCRSCPFGRFAARASSVSCAKCVPGRYSDEPALRHCKLCVGGRYAVHRGAETCTACAAGRFGAVPAAATSSDACVACSAGQFQAHEGSADCDKCPPGTFGTFVGATTAAHGCTGCAPGRFQSEPAARECYKCPRGQLQPLAGQKACMAPMCKHLELRFVHTQFLPPGAERFKGAYALLTSLYHGHPVYAKKGGGHIFLYYLEHFGLWVLGPNIGDWTVAAPSGAAPVHLAVQGLGNTPPLGARRGWSLFTGLQQMRVRPAELVCHDIATRAPEGLGLRDAGSPLPAAPVAAAATATTTHVVVAHVSTAPQWNRTTAPRQSTTAVLVAPVKATTNACAHSNVVLNGTALVSVQHSAKLRSVDFCMAMSKALSCARAHVLGWSRARPGMLVVRFRLNGLPLRTVQSIRTPHLEQEVLARVRSLGAIDFQIVALRASRVAARHPAATAAAVAAQVSHFSAGQAGEGGSGGAAMSARARSSLIQGAVIVLLLWTMACVHVFVSPATAVQERQSHTGSGIALNKR